LIYRLNKDQYCWIVVFVVVVMVLVAGVVVTEIRGKNVEARDF
jgi:Na+-transporting NADH:ubiquinone oxidoreductase subunit NqrC